MFSRRHPRFFVSLLLHSIAVVYSRYHFIVYFTGCSLMARCNPTFILSLLPRFVSLSSRSIPLSTSSLRFSLYRVQLRNFSSTLSLSTAPRPTANLIEPRRELQSNVFLWFHCHSQPHHTHSLFGETDALFTLALVQSASSHNDHPHPSTIAFCSHLQLRSFLLMCISTNI